MAEKHLNTYSKQMKLLVILAVLLVLLKMYYNSTEFRKLPNIPYLTTEIVISPAIYYKSIPKTDKKTILYWNTFFGNKDMNFGTGSAIFQHCSVNNCVATYNKNDQPVMYFDAIIFHGPRYSMSTDRIPKQRSIHQKYIFYSLESPYNTNFDPVVNRHFYNWTMTYRRDSDIYRPYARVVKSKLDNYKMPDVNAIKARGKKVAWFVSNCRTEGSKRRMKYAQELRKYIPVDIYGTCGNLSCTDQKQCYQMLEKDYKFYLSFENSMCEDYITEKLFNVLQYDIVPIVLNYFDYTKQTPPNSVINTQNYGSPQALAQYLWSLDNDPVAYLKFFEWKHEFRIDSSNQHILCQICEALHKPATYFSYENVENWFYGFNCVI